MREGALGSPRNSRDQSPQGDASLTISHKSDLRLPLSETKEGDEEGEIDDREMRNGEITSKEADNG